MFSITKENLLTFDVTNTMLDRLWELENGWFGSSRYSCDNLKLQKLLYLGKEIYSDLFTSPMIAFKHSPIVPVIYEKFLTLGSLIRAELDKKETKRREVINTVVKKYGHWEKEYLDNLIL